MNIAIIGASGGIGREFVRFFLEQNKGNLLYVFSRTSMNFNGDRVVSNSIDYSNEDSIQHAAERAVNNGPLDVVIVATGMLHEGELQPEKCLNDLSLAKFERSFLVNSIGPALVAKHFLPALRKDRTSLFAALSARVGSISDNRLGGWYAYRASKAALNMLIKTASIEISRKNKHAVVVGLHPGTVATQLSEPFQKRVPKEKLFSSTFSVQQMTTVLAGLTPKDSGKIFAWDGKEIPA